MKAVTDESWRAWEKLCEITTSASDELFEQLKVALDEYVAALDEYCLINWDDPDGPEKVDVATKAHSKARAAWRAWKAEWKKEGGGSKDLTGRTFNALMTMRGYPSQSAARRDIEELDWPALMPAIEPAVPDYMTL